MLTQVALLQVDSARRKWFEAGAAGSDLDLVSFDDIDTVFESLSETPRAWGLVVLGVGVPDPIRTAQKVHGIDGDLGVLILCDERRYQHTDQILKISPFLGTQVRCCPAGDAVPADLSNAVTRTRGRRRHHAWLEAARRSLAADEPPTRSVQLLDRLLNQAPIGVVLATHLGRIVACNKMVERLLKIQEQDVLGTPLRELFAGVEQARVEALLDSAAGDTHGIDWETVETRNADGATCVLRLNASSVSARGDERLLLILLDDITDAKRREEALLESRAALRDVAGRLITIEEDGRIRLARELHDDVTQRIAMLALDASRMRRRGDLAPGLDDELEGIRSRLVQLAEDVRSMSRQLHPSVLSHLGLEDAIATECDRLSTAEGLVIDFEPPGLPDAIPDDAALCIYRTLQEALANVLRHSHAEHADVVLARAPGGVTLTVRDAGVGFDPALAGQRRTLGLISMNERARLVHGTLTVRSQPGEGTTVVLHVPVRSPDLD